MQLKSRRKNQIGLLFLLMLVASVAEVISIGAVIPFLGMLSAPERAFEAQWAKFLIGWLNLSHPSELLLPLTLLFAVAALFSGAVRLCLLWAQTRLSYAIGADLGIEIYRRTLYQPYAVHVARNSSEVISGISQKSSAVVSGMVLPALTLLSSLLILGSIVAALLALQPYVAVSAFLGFGVIYVAIVLISRRKLEEYSRLISENHVQLLKALQEGLGGIRDVLIDGTQDVYCRIYHEADLVLRRASAGTTIIAGGPRFAIEAMGMILIAFIAYFIARSTSGLAETIPILGALALGSQRLLPILQQVYSSWVSIKSSSASLTDAIDLLEQPLPDQHVLEPEQLVFQSQIEFRDVSFQYTPTGPMVLKGVSLTIPKGERIGVVGTTGSGKSTLMDLLMGLLVPGRGTLLVDGVSITQKNNRSWQTHIAHVPQSVFLADISIAENIAFGVSRADIDYKKVREAAEKAQIGETIESWEAGYQTLVGERGIRLSGGQRQRIGIARALYKKASVIVLDEATSALDGETESSVMTAIEALGRQLTIIIVAHRLSTLTGCTQVVEISEGRVAKVERFDQIIEADLRDATTLRSRRDS